MSIFAMSMAILFVVLQLADSYSTWYILTKKNGTEQNKLLAKIFAKIGVIPGLAIVKFIAIVMVMFVSASKETYVPWFIGFSDLCYIYVVYHNIVQMKKPS